MAAMTLLAVCPGSAAQDSKTGPRLQKFLQLSPQADANEDGILTQAEAQKYREKLRQSKAEPAQALLEAVACHTEMVPMRDGVRLATSICLPAGGGSWPVVLIRTPYGRKDQVNKSGNYLKNRYAFVAQDWRGLFDSEGKFTPEVMSGHVNSDDGYDTVEWIARQSWSNGKVGITGGSGPGIAAKQAVLANPPHLVAADVSVASMFPRDFALYHGGVPLSQNDAWAEQRGVKSNPWPKPRPPQFDFTRYSWPADHRKEAAPCGRIAVLDHGGWYDIFSPSVLDDFMAIGGKNNRAIVAAKGHGAVLEGLKYPPQDLPASSAMAWFDHWLKGNDTGVMNTPPIRYFLMGDTMRTGAPGNVWKQADHWPIPSTPLYYYLQSDGKLSTDKPRGKSAPVTYAYDPKNPVPTVGGANLGENRGPLDQRKLKDRKDIIRFVSEPLSKPIEITGNVIVELYVTPDVADTSIMVKFIDVYPNGYEALMLDNAIMARYWKGFNKAAPLEKGRIRKLTLDLWKTALILDKGHRIAVHITGSNTPRYEIHPNSFEPVSSYENAPIAHISVATSAEHASRLILPSIAPGVSKDYNPDK